MGIIFLGEPNCLIKEDKDLVDLETEDRFDAVEKNIARIDEEVSALINDFTPEVIPYAAEIAAAKAKEEAEAAAAAAEAAKAADDAAAAEAAATAAEAAKPKKKGGGFGIFLAIAAAVALAAIGIKNAKK